MAARLGKEEAARLVLHWVVGGDLVPLLSMGGKLLQASKFAHLVHKLIAE